MADLAKRVSGLIHDLVEEEGLELVHVEFMPAGPAPILRVYVDREGGVTLTDCAGLSRQISVLLDVEDLISSKYLLEVSSPGIERPLFQERDYQRFMGQEIRLVTAEKIDNRRNFRGTIEDFKNGVLQLHCEGRLFEIPFRLIKKANLVYHF